MPGVGTGQCPAEPDVVDISLDISLQAMGCWAINTLPILGLQPRLPPRALQGSATEEEISAFMSIPLSHHRPSFFCHFSENMVC